MCRIFHQVFSGITGALGEALGFNHCIFDGVRSCGFQALGLASSTSRSPTCMALSSKLFFSFSFIIDSSSFFSSADMGLVSFLRSQLI